MKRFFVLLLACLMIVPFALASDLSDFNAYAYVFGASEIEDGTSSVIEGQDVEDFSSDGCRIVFMKKDGDLSSIVVVGQGDKFLAYCAAAIHQFDGSSENRTTNFGNLLSIYLLSLGGEVGENHSGFTVSNEIMTMTRTDEGCQFVILSIK